MLRISCVWFHVSCFAACSAFRVDPGSVDPGRPWVDPSQPNAQPLPHKPDFSIELESKLQPGAKARIINCMKELSGDVGEVLRQLQNGRWEIRLNQESIDSPGGVKSLPSAMLAVIPQLMKKELSGTVEVGGAAKLLKIGGAAVNRVRAMMRFVLGLIFVKVFCMCIGVAS